MPFGFVLYGGSRSVSFDSEYGLRSKSSSAPPLRKGRFVASEATVKTYLTKHGVDNVKSIKFGEPKFPKHEHARKCDAILELFAENVFEYPEGAEYHRNQLINYCGIEMELA